MPPTEFLFTAQETVATIPSSIPQLERTTRNGVDSPLRPESPRATHHQRCSLGVFDNSLELVADICFSKLVTTSYSSVTRSLTRLEFIIQALGFANVFYCDLIIFHKFAVWLLPFSIDSPSCN
jgi:hypothetical protein